MWYIVIWRYVLRMCCVRWLCKLFPSLSLLAHGPSSFRFPDQGTIGADRARLTITMTILRRPKAQLCDSPKSEKLTESRGVVQLFERVQNSENFFIAPSLRIHDTHDMELKDGNISSRKPIVHRFSAPVFPRSRWKGSRIAFTSATETQNMWIYHGTNTKLWGWTMLNQTLYPHNMLSSKPATIIHYHSLSFIIIHSHSLSFIIIHSL